MLTSRHFEVYVRQPWSILRKQCVEDKEVVDVADARPTTAARQASFGRLVCKSSREIAKSANQLCNDDVSGNNTLSRVFWSSDTVCREISTVRAGPVRAVAPVRAVGLKRVQVSQSLTFLECCVRYSNAKETKRCVKWHDNDAAELHTRTVVRECCKDDDQSQWKG